MPVLTFCLCWIFSFGGMASDIKLTLDHTPPNTYGSIQTQASLNEFRIISLPHYPILPSEIWRNITTYLPLEDQLSMLKLSHYFYEGLYHPNRDFMYTPDLIALFLKKHLSHANRISFSDAISPPLHKVAIYAAMAKSKTNGDILRIFKKKFHRLREKAEQKKHSPSFMISGAGEDLDQIIEIDNQLSINNPIIAKKSPNRFKNLCVSLCRDRRFMAGVGLVTLGALIIGGYYITVDPIQKQAYASFMNQTQIPAFSIDPNFNYDIPSCFDSCALSTGSGFFTNHPGCHNSHQDPQCICYGEPINTTCYMTPDSICPDGGCANLIIGNSTQWINALASECNFNRTSGHWVNYIQSILNKTRSPSDRSEMYTCTPSIDGTSIICGISWGYCWYMNGICMYLYSGSAQCAAELARYQHMVNYFAPTSVLFTLIVAIVGAYWYWC